MDMPKKQLVAEALIDLHRRLTALPTRSHERRMIMQETANLYGVSEQTLYRALAQRARPRALRRSDRGTPRVLPQDKMAYYCELIAALKFRTSNKKGRHLSTGEAIRLIEEFGVETPDGLIKAQKSTFKTTAVNRYLRQWGYEHETLRRQPAAVRFQGEHSNDCWQFDLSPSETIVKIDEQKLRLKQFGKLLSAYEGWGMRIEFVPTDEVHHRPVLEVREPR